MIHKSVDELILHVGGISGFLRELEKEQIVISFSAVKKWYTSNQINPGKRYHEAILKIAQRHGKEIRF